MHSGHRNRIRQRFLKEGLDGFEDHQILELLLFYSHPRQDTNPVAHQLLSRFGSLAAVLEANIQDLKEVTGIGEQSAILLNLLPQLTRRYLHDRVNRQRLRLQKAKEVAAYMIPLMAGRATEVFYVLCLDVQSRVVYAERIETGLVNATFVHPRQVVECALRHRAVSVIVAHNHPSGNLQPSAEDIHLTKMLLNALKPLEIGFPDHLIVADDRYLSLLEAGLMPR
jgi:DNA repair protein RadC